MKAVIQRVLGASVSVDDTIVGNIEQGLLVLLGIHNDDQPSDILWMAKKIAQIRIFSDEHGKMNRSIKDVEGALLIISQFTLFGDARKGNRPSFTDAANPEMGLSYYEQVCQCLERDYGILAIQKGIFGAHMQVELRNDGPVTILLDSKMV